jgi:predicted metal-dependent hydrolase
LAKIGLPAAELSSEFLYSTLKAKKRFDRLFGPAVWLPVIVAGEHNAACIMEYLLERPALLAKMHPHFRQAWVWHCLEEIEHKGSSMDMWHDTKKLHNRTMFKLKVTCFGAAFKLNYFTMINMFALLKHDKQLWKWRTLKDGLSFFLGRDGLVTKTIVPFLKCLKPSWHPWDHDTRYLIDQYQKITLANSLSAEELAKIDIEFHTCIVDIEKAIKENNQVKVY